MVHNYTTMPYIPKFATPFVHIFLDSLKIIFLDNPKLFFSIYIAGVLPLSLIITSFYVSSNIRQLKSHIVRLEWLVRVVEIWVEADNIREESKADLKILYRFKAFYGIPVLVFSLVTLVVTVMSTFLTSTKKKPTLRDAVKVRWVCPLITCIFCFGFRVVWGHFLPFLTTVAGYPASVVVVIVAGVVEVYVMAVMSLGLVVSVAEERAGFDAVWVGLGLMKERRLCGWVLSGLILLGSNCIGREMVEVLDGQDTGMNNGGYSPNRWMEEMKVGYMIGLVLLLAWVVLWSNVIFTVFYCDCKKRYVIREDEQLDDDTQI